MDNTNTPIVLDKIESMKVLRSVPLSIDIETTTVQDFKDLSSVRATVIVVSKPSFSTDDDPQVWKFVRDEALECEDVLPMSALRPLLYGWFKKGCVLGGQNILGFDFPVMMQDDTLDVKDILDAFVATRQVVDTSKYISDRYGFRVSLKYMAQGSVGDEKLMDGADAPDEWAKGNHSEEIDYCVQDTILWSKIHDFGVKHGFIDIGGPKLKVDW